MRFGLVLAALVGLALATWLVVAVGFASIFAAMLAVGWSGFLGLCASGAALFGVLGAAWFAVMPRQSRAPFLNFVWSRAVRECAGELLPFSQIGGIVIGARALALRGVDGSVALGSSIVDVTEEMIAQIVFVLAGLVFLLTVARHVPSSAALARSVAVGVLAAIIAAGLFFRFQQQGIAAVARHIGRWSPKTGAWFGDLHQSLAGIHAAPARLAISLVIHLCGWIGTALWAWLALFLMGKPIPFPFVFIIEAILCAIRSAAIIVPGAIGVQEASYALIAPLLGLSAPDAIALSLMKRARDVAIGVPVLLVWQLAEGGRAWKGGRKSVR